MRASSIGTRPRPAIGWVAVVVAIALAGVAWLWARQPSAEERQHTADALVAGIQATVSVRGDSLLAARAIADFGVGGEVRLVRVRIVDELRIDVRVDVAKDLDVAIPIVACLVGPDAAPDDAGLSDRCWGAGDLGTNLASALATDAGRFRVPGGTPLMVEATVRRGDAGCDYPPGTWRLELLVDPIVDGEPVGPRYAPDATFEVPFQRDEPLRAVEERRYCGLASKVYREQGEPVVIVPSGAAGSLELGLRRAPAGTW